MTTPLFTAFSDEFQQIQRLKLASPLGVAKSWLKGQYAQLGNAAAQASQGHQSFSPMLGQPAPPIVGTITNFLANKLPTPKKPPGPVIEGAKRLLSSKPAKTIIPLIDQTSEFLKLAHEHYIEYCSCGNVISRCRCMGPHEKRVTPNGCSACRGVEKTAQVAPYQQKTQYSCSAACLKAVLEHWGADRFAEHEIMYAIGVRDRGGAEVDEITRGAQKLGFDAYDKCFSSLDEAKAITDQGIPIIADFQSFNNPGKGHYVVITQIDDNVVHLMDPNTDGNQRVITRAECEQRWWDKTMAPPHNLMVKWGVVVTPRSGDGTR